MTNGSRPDASLKIATHACREILRTLQLVSDAPANRLGEPRPPQRGTSRIPSGVSLNGQSSDHAPSKRFSLYAHYRWRMDRAFLQKDATKLHALAVEATRDYEEYIGTRKPLHFEHDDDAVAELLREHTGVPAEHAAIKMMVQNQSLKDATTWVRRQRARNGRDQEFGEPREFNADARRMFALQDSGASFRTIAAEVGCSLGHVSNVLNGRGGRAGTRSRAA